MSTDYRELLKAYMYAVLDDDYVVGLRCAEDVKDPEAIAIMKEVHQETDRVWHPYYKGTQK